MKKLLYLSLLITAINNTALGQCDAQFTFYSFGVNAGFTDSSAGSGILTYHWDFGDGDSSTMQNPYHTYPGPGTYNVCLQITDSLGCIDSTCQTVICPNTALSVDNILVYGLHCDYPASETIDYYISTFGYSNTDTLHIEINFGDGTDTSFYRILNYPSLSENAFHVYYNPGTYFIQIIVTSPDLVDSIVSPPIEVFSNCGPVSGTVYKDLNNDCIIDPGEELSGIALEIYDGTQFMGWVQSDSAGVYSFSVPAGPSYDIKIRPYVGFTSYTPACPPTGMLTVTVPSTGNNMGVTCPPVYDLQGHLTGWRFRPGFTGYLGVSAFNQFCNTPNGQIVLTFDSLYTPLPDTINSLYSVNGFTVTMNINSSELYWNFCVPISVSLAAISGDSMCVGFSILPITGDSIPSNNTGTFCFPVRNSWDPNDKYGIPEGQSPSGFIHPNEDITYTIRFQNTGTADAINIFILDTLDADLDAHSFEVIGSSHPMQHALLAGNILRFTFNNINLPDSGSNEPASHGYVSYRIKQQNNLAHMTAINNTAGIYFDFNPAVITNTTLHTVDHFLALKPVITNSTFIKVFPNPANLQCRLQFSNNQKRNISVTDIAGKVIFTTTVNSDNYLLHTEKFADGNYLVRITDENNFPELIKLVVNH